MIKNEKIYLRTGIEKFILAILQWVFRCIDSLYARKLIRNERKIARELYKSERLK
jgi:hypothetical protein